MPAPAFQQAINRHFHDQLEMLGWFRPEPWIEIVGAYPLPADLAQAATRHALALQASGKPDDAHLILCSPLGLDTGQPRLQAQTIAYAGICALREQGQRPAILSASALLVCRETEQLLLQRRSPELATHPGCLHIIGGACHPELDQLAGQCGLWQTVRREVTEETGITIPEDFPASYSLVKEKSTGFVQLALPGLDISADQLQGANANWEGSLLRVDFRDLPALLQDSAWVPSGKAQLLHWLALAAPAGQLFDGMTAAELFRNVLRQADL